MTKTFKQLKKSGAEKFEFLQEEALNSAMLLVGVNQEKALNGCLVSSGNSHLQGMTLLAKAVRKEHSALMVERFMSLAHRVTGEKKMVLCRNLVLLMRHLEIVCNLLPFCMRSVL
jgi:hypothetical protein